LKVEKGVGMIVSPASGKIFDITHADANEHTVPLPAGLPENTKAMLIFGDRIGGTGIFRAISTAGDGNIAYVGVANNLWGLWVRAADGLFHYKLSVAGDDWDIYVLGVFFGE
jgi:hypothetical protein